MRILKKNKYIILTLVAFFYLLLTTQGLGGRAQYTYDNLNCLVQVQYDDGTTIQYSYDAAGNRLNKEVTAFNLPGSPEGQGSRSLYDPPLIQSELPPPGGSRQDCWCEF